MDELEKTLDPQQAAIEAERCLYCFDAPCQAACPARVPVPEFIQSLRSGNLHGARVLLQESNPFIETCGRICPEESFCQSVCTRAQIDTPLRIRELHRSVTDRTDPADRLDLPIHVHGKIAVVGAGPAGLSCARDLALYGLQVDVFEQLRPGGVPTQEVSRRRYPTAVEERETRFLASRFVVHVWPHRVSDISTLLGNYAAVFVATGLPGEMMLPVEGMGLDGVFHARALLRAVKSGEASGVGRRVGVVGGGNVAVEVATALRDEDPTRDVTVIYRRGIKELKAFKKEIDAAIAAGVTFQFLAAPDRIIGTRHVEGLQVVQTHLCEEDETGRCRFEALTGSTYVIPLDTVVAAIGQRPDAEAFPQLARDDTGLIRVDEEMKTSVLGVFAGGDAVRGAQTVVEAVRDGKKAAASIAAYLAGGQ